MCSKHSWRITGAIAFGLLMFAALAITWVIPLRRGYTAPYGSSSSITAHVRSAAQTNPAVRAPENLQATRLPLQSKVLWTKQTSQRWNRSIESFRQNLFKSYGARCPSHLEESATLAREEAGIHSMLSWRLFPPVRRTIRIIPMRRRPNITS